MMSRKLCLALLLGTAGLPASAVPLTFGISPGSTDIGFAVDILGVATAAGAFRHFSGSLTLDLDHPEKSAVIVRIDSNSAAMGWEPAASMVAGESYLDVDHYPEIRFASHLVTITGKDRVRMEGMLTLRGVTHWESFEAELVDRRMDPENSADSAEFAAIGSVRRSDYQMDGGQAFLDDRVTFTIRTRLSLNPVPAP
jgi:polyisoprenoid-binding protein YceI